MIVKEFYRTREDGVNLYRTFSDQNLKIRKVGTDEIYDEAIDVDGAPYTYEETTESLENVDGWYEVDEPTDETKTLDEIT